MATNQTHLPIKASVYDGKGGLIAEHSFGNLSRSSSVSLELDTLLNARAPDTGHGHVELAYDFAADQQRFNRSQMSKAAMVMAAEYDKKGGVMSVQMVRSDLL